MRTEFNRRHDGWCVVDYYKGENSLTGFSGRYSQRTRKLSAKEARSIVASGSSVQTQTSFQRRNDELPLEIFSPLVITIIIRNLLAEL